MSIRTISTGQLRRMGDQEGLVLQGCGGDPQEWVDGINEILAQEGILKKGAGFEEAYTFRHDGLTCMLFPFKEDMELDVGRLAAWRLASYSTFGGTWLSDYVPNRLGGFIQEQKSSLEGAKPDCPLIGEDGNIFHIMGIASEALRENGMQEQAEEMRSRIFQCQSYDSALSIIGDYVNIRRDYPYGHPGGHAGGSGDWTLFHCPDACIPGTYHHSGGGRGGMRWQPVLSL